MTKPTPAQSGELHDVEDIYDEQISPLMTKIIAICKEHGIPVVATFQLTCGGEEDIGGDPPLFCTTAIPTEWQADRMKNILRAARESGLHAFTITTETR